MSQIMQIIFQINKCNFFTFLSESRKQNKHNCFNIDNNQKCFLSSKSEYENDFWRSCETEGIMLKIQLRITEINYILQSIYLENSYILNCSNISQYYYYTVFTVFLMK